MLKTLKEIRKINDSFPCAGSLQQWRDKGKKTMGWGCNYVPEEIIHAAGMIPVRVTGGKEEIQTEEADAFLHIYSCSFSRTCLQLLMNKEFDFLDGFIGCAVCDGMRRLADSWEECSSIPLIYNISLPRKTHDEAVKFYEEELEILRGKIEKQFGSKVTDSELIESMKLFNRTRELFKRLYKLRKRKRPPLWGSEFQEILNASALVPREEFNPLLEEIIEECEKSGREVEGKVRLMLNGSILNSVGFIKGIEEMGG